MKNITIRAFRIENFDIGEADSGLLPLLSKKLKGSKVKERSMLLNQNDENKEEDLLLDYQLQSNLYVSGLILRMCPTETTVEIPDDILDKEKVSITDLNFPQTGTKKVHKHHYYFLLNNQFLVTNLQGNITIPRFQVYINWLLKDLRGTKMFEFTPLTSPPPDIKLNRISSIILQDPPINKKKNEDAGENTILNLLLNLKDEALKILMDDVDSINKIDKEKIISAKLLLKFRKPRKMSKEEYVKVTGAMLKPISDLDNVEFHTNDGKKIKGVDIQVIKKVDIEETTSGKISEQHLFQEMETFIKELLDEQFN